MKRVLLTVLGILFFAGITFGVLSVLHRPAPVQSGQTMTTPPKTQTNYSATAPQAPKLDAAGNVSCEANPENKGMIIQTSTIDANGQPVTRIVQC
jgi:uncharacterized membrane protein YagU involved in acid resistance